MLNMWQSRQPDNSETIGTEPIGSVTESSALASKISDSRLHSPHSQETDVLSRANDAKPQLHRRPLNPSRTPSSIPASQAQGPARILDLNRGKRNSKLFRNSGSNKTSYRLQQTLADDLCIQGVGLHSGIDTVLKIKPARENTGLVFVRSDLDPDLGRIEGRYNSVTDTLMCTKLSNQTGAVLGTVEHLLSALRGLEIDNAIIEVDGPEVPVLDGSSIEIFDALKAVGIVEQDAPRQVIRLLKEISVGDASCGAKLKPLDADSTGFAVDFTIKYECAAIGEQSHTYAFDPATYASEIADCRTFGFFEDVEKLKSMGLGKGGSLDNAVVIKNQQVMNPGGLRHSNEFVRHKILDALGDLYLAGMQIEGVYEGICSGHRVNNELLRALFDRPEAWTLVYQTEHVSADQDAVVAVG